MSYEEQLEKEKDLLAINCYNIDYSSLTKPAQLLMDKCAEYLLSQKAEAYRKGWIASEDSTKYDLESELQIIGYIKPQTK